MRWRVALLVALAGILGGGALVASNMGFLVWRTLSAAGPDSRSGTQTLALPYQRDADLLTATNLLNDLGLANVANVQRFIEGTDGLLIHTGRKGSFSFLGSPTNFPLIAGQCYFIKMNTTINYLIGGSSDPSVVLQLDAAGPNSWSGTNFIALPYHATANSASQLLQDIGLANVANVQRFVAATDSLQAYTGRKGSPPDFPLVPTECYLVKMNTTTSYIPSHW